MKTLKMKQLCLIVFSALAAQAAIAKVIVVEGKYQNKNLYIQNGYSSSGVGFCTYEIIVNGEVSTDEINSTSFEIDLAQFQLKYGQKVVVEIKHKDDCSPRILNPEALKPKASFETTSLTLAHNGLLSWSTVNEAGSLPFIVEQFKWNKWIPVGEVQGLGTPAENRYSFQTELHSGENKFRVKQVGYGALPKYSKTVSVISNETPLTFSTSRNSEDLLFSGETMFEVYDVYGQVIKKGFGKSINIGNIKKGHYFLCYDNSVTEFKKK
ncbi:MAG: hypothetical protein HYU69_05900 [Bacteroidetes bacterium]|nr:hypothetical protein [Bacteroidota bacterium]